MPKAAIKVLAAASAGGHWDQLMLMRPTLEHYDVQFVTTDPELAAMHGISAVEIIPDCSRDTPLRMLHCALVALTIIMRHRPQVVVTTGAAPGFFCILAARLLGARTLWIDSVANGEQLSRGGKLARTFAHNCWTQWEHLAAADQPRFCGSLL
jgi:UDP-N-acetylglucosamine:LPS N-acetylglucosamine transferase